MSKPKILLVLLPFWDPLIPPMGLASLKSYLKENGYEAKTVDGNVREEFKEIQDIYYSILKSAIPQIKRGNFYNIAKEIFHNQLMAHFNKTNEEKYFALVSSVIYHNFYYHVPTPTIHDLSKILDGYYERLKDFILGLLKNHDPDIFGISVFKGTVSSSMFAFRLAKEYNNKIITIMGGGIFADQLEPGSPDFARFLEKNPCIDKFFEGEGELLLLKFLQGKLPADKRIYSIHDIDDYSININSLPDPDFSDFQQNYYPFPAAYTSRGCPFNCSFCSETIRWGHYRKKNADKVIGELKEMFNKDGSQLFLMCDSLLNPIINSLSESIIEDNLPVYWDGYFRVDKHASDKQTVEKWRKGGFYRARLGVESASARILKLMGKVITPDQIRETVRNLAEVGIKTTTYWVVGYPGETEEDFQETLNCIEELSDCIYEAEYNPFLFYYSGQSNSDKWEYNKYLVYSDEKEDMLLLQTWDLDCVPSRQVRFERMKKFYDHCSGLNIPNPYSLYEIHKADQRWQKLHKNAVPPMASFKSDKIVIDPARDIIRQINASTNLIDINFNL